ncbi:MAG: hypothetical protein UV43_C0048G0009 [Parcubacteria group bacterium GW2011_GWF2_42_7]|nr:MAG: hypothetical protein UV22_C0003G0002 [Parcubacteria group bacterium GW2011_GWA2_42_35]KKS70961.1 MAG: hypothetical protein UV43_C0048G0009 [Parcubacteria group bacterium GW2011_GWF2_42_7]
MSLGLMTALAIAGLSTVYFIYQLRGVIFGPYLAVSSPFDGEVLEQSYTTIKGKAGQANFLSLNGRKVFVDRNNEFSHSLLLASGYNIIELTTKDNFGREIKIKKEVMLK